ncbi:Protein CBG04930, partial [Caenorhabditis briggsae]
FPVEKDAQRVNKYEDHVPKINFEGFEFPFQVKDVDKFERRNKLAVNIVSDCMSNAPIQMIKPSKDYIKFEGIQETQKHRYVCYADFESVIPKIDSVSNSPNKSWSENIGKHAASGFCVIVVDSFTQSIYDMKSYIGYDTILKFNEYILDVCERLLNIPDKKMIDLTEEQWEEYNSCKTCHGC